ncbi:MAG: hypothetical protein ACUVRZ_09440 [Desulfobacca sp.]|uniref:hypothetical protein n=1 Tax=Desulfobacca sp. TaxID=2067990 RepID=UPI00404A023F
MTSSFPYDLVTLGHFPAGWGWEGQLRAYIRKKYRQDLDGLADLPPARLAACLGGEEIPERPYDTIRWGLRLQPFRPLALFFFYNLDPEFGTDLRVFYHRASLAVPTEDAYVFAWDYVALLARYGRGSLPLDLQTPGADWLDLAALEAQHGPGLQRFTWQGRAAVLRGLTPEVAAAASWRLASGQCQTRNDGWLISWAVLPDLLLRVGREGDRLDLAYEANGAAKYGPEFLISFAWLYLNALLRQARQVDPTLPQLSSYF